MFLCSVNRLVKFIKYKWNASGRHGIHSPFIYDLIENGIRTSIIKADFHPSDLKNIEFQKFVFKLLRYFKVKNIFINEQKGLNHWETFFRINFSSLNIHVNLEELSKSSKNPFFDFIFISNSTQIVEKISKLLTYSENETVFLIEGIRSNKYSFEEWRKLCEMKTFHVSIDFFQSGLLILRSQQEKEHFTLKTT